MLDIHDRGYACLKDIVKCSTHCLLIEPCFGNLKNPDSEKLFKVGGDDFYAKALAEAIIECTGIKRNDYTTALEFENLKLRDILTRVKNVIDSI